MSELSVLIPGKGLIAEASLHLLKCVVGAHVSTHRLRFCVLKSSAKRHAFAAAPFGSWRSQGGQLCPSRARGARPIPGRPQVTLPGPELPCGLCCMQRDFQVLAASSLNLAKYSVQPEFLASGSSAGAAVAMHAHRRRLWALLQQAGWNWLVTVIMFILCVIARNVREVMP